MTVLPLFTSLFRTSRRTLTSSKCKPVVGSSRIYMVFPVSFLDNSVASFNRCASPPESVVDCCPNLMYPRPTSCRVLILWYIEGMLEKNSTALSTVISSTSLMFFPLYFTSRVSRLYLLPLQSLQFTYTSGRKFISMVFTPAPWQPSHLPPFILKENRPAPNPLIFASVVCSNSFLISVNTPVYVAGFDLGVLPIGDWFTSITLSIFS